MSKVKPKAKGTSRATKPRKATTARLSSPKSQSKGPSRAGAKTKPSAASRPIDQRLRELGDWRDQTLSRMRALILEADPEMIEERKWRKPSNAMYQVS
jgi:hypothetical protein